MYALRAIRVHVATSVYLKMLEHWPSRRQDAYDRWETSRKRDSRPNATTVEWGTPKGQHGGKANWN